VMNLKWSEDREEPTAAEAEFIGLLGNCLH
jgi:hypothetical protein